MSGDIHVYAALRWLLDRPTREIVQQGASEDVDRLIADFGIEGAREATLGIVLFRALRVGRCVALEYDAFWTRALARGLASNHLAKSFGLEDPIRAFLSGLFADIGKIFIAESNPTRYDELIYDRDTTQASDLRAREREWFGIDRDTVAWIVLRDLGFSREVFVSMLVNSRQQRSDGQPPVGHDPMEYEVQRMARLIGSIICADKFERTQLWGDFVRLRTLHDMSRDALNTLCDGIVNDWWDWGDLTVVPTRNLPGFSELCDWNERGIEPVRYNPMGTAGLLPKPQGDRLYVLLVDDDRVILEATRRRLERAGHRVVTARDGEQAMSILRQDPPQVVLSDWRMPKMDGLELCRNLRRTELGRRTFFILFTGEEKEEEIVKAYEDGINDFINKRSPQPILLARVRAARTFLAQWEQVDQDRRIIRAHCEQSRKQASRMKTDSLTDALTGLPNRRYAMERLREEWARAERSSECLSVVMLDIDNFKQVNDQFGHDVGDLVLMETAAMLRTTTRRNEAACRIGGEEFLIICSGEDLGSAVQCAERVRKAIEANIVEAKGFDRSVTISLGVAQRSPLVDGLDGLLKAADEAIYGAKEGGRNQVVVWPAMERVNFDEEERRAG